jgi:hypothetical protein
MAFKVFFVLLRVEMVKFTDVSEQFASSSLHPEGSTINCFQVQPDSRHNLKEHGTIDS